VPDTTFVGIDVGTTGVKGVAVDENARAHIEEQLARCVASLAESPLSPRFKTG
jgi:sugar (pentulose or hexulose) kinase